jgi:hypothetical protein
LVHSRSVLAEQKRLAERLVLATAFQDKRRCEAVNMTSPGDLQKVLYENFGYVCPGAVDVEKGEVLIDSRGQGSLQR